MLRSARWMADHERPYLDVPEILEYPTETWAAQDMRKAEVFAAAAQCADGPQQARLLERAASFFDYSVSTLLEQPTRGYARPLVLLLSNGFRYLGSAGAAGRRRFPAVARETFAAPPSLCPPNTLPHDP